MKIRAVAAGKIFHNAWLDLTALSFFFCLTEGWVMINWLVIDWLFFWPPRFVLWQCLTFTLWKGQFFIQSWYWIAYWSGRVKIGRLVEPNFILVCSSAAKFSTELCLFNEYRICSWTTPPDPLLPSAFICWILPIPTSSLLHFKSFGL